MAAAGSLAPHCVTTLRTEFARCVGSSIVAAQLKAPAGSFAAWEVTRRETAVSRASPVGSVLIHC